MGMRKEKEKNLLWEKEKRALLAKLMCNMTRSPHRHRQIGKDSSGKDVESEDSHLTWPIWPPQPAWGPGYCHTLLTLRVVQGHV